MSQPTPAMEASAHHFRICHLCEAMCGVDIEHRNGGIVSIKGDKADPFSKGHICPKAVALKDLHEDPDRLRRPVKRVATGWVEISWDEAFDEIETNLRRLRSDHGGDALAVYLGNPTVHTPALLAVPSFVRALGAKQRFSATSVDQLPTMIANQQLFGHQLLFPVPDLDRCEFLLIVGGNPAASNGSLMSAGDVMGRIRGIRERGGRVVVIDPRRTETADKADDHLFVRPGTDFFLLAAMVTEMFAAKVVRLRDFDRLVEGLDALRTALAPYTPESVAAITGVEAARIRALAMDVARAERAAIYGRVGACTQEFGGLTTWLLHVLNILTGNLDRAGGMMFATPPLDMVKLGSPGTYGRQKSRVRGLPAFGGELPVAVLAEEILTPGPGQIRALVTHAGNPVLSTPNGAQMDRALAALDYMVSIDIYINETTRHAHIILPPVSPLERSHMEVGLSPLMVRNAAKWSPALFEPPVDSRQDWQILLALTQRLSGDGGLGRYMRQGMQSVMERLGLDSALDVLLRTGPYGTHAALGKKASVLSRMGAVLRPDGEGLSLKKLRAHPHGIDLGPLLPQLQARLEKMRRRIPLLPAVYEADLPRARQALTNFDATQMRVIGRRHVRSNNSWMHNSHRLVKGPSRCTALLHPDDAARLGIADGAPVKLASRVGAIELPAELSDAVMPGVVSVPHGFGHGRAGVKLRVAQAEAAGPSLNDIIDDQLVDAVSGTAVLNGMAVEVSAV
ncbi:MAG: molybdopterin-dependent oxidoreductase [Moraxellaceae bacterium]|nr:molybdopterin-dependent oxidoreductase [Moraxellaceae bacterium]